MTRLEQMIAAQDDSLVKYEILDIAKLKDHYKLSMFSNGFIQECWEEFSESRCARWLDVGDSSGEDLWQWLNEEIK